LKGIGREGREKEQDLGEDEGALEGKGGGNHEKDCDSPLLQMDGGILIGM